MSASTMKKLHDTAAAVAPWQWRLGARSAQRLAAAPVARWLAVEEGRVWLTRSPSRGPSSLEPPEDVWLAAGERLPLPPGTDWVAEGWPEARVVVLEAPAAGRRA